MDNRAIFSANLKRYMELNQKSRKEICDALGFNYYTFSDWVNGKKYPRMDKIERLASYFSIQKSDLIEDKNNNAPSVFPSAFSSRFRILVETFDLSMHDIQKITGIDKGKLTIFLNGSSDLSITATEIIEIAHAFNVSEAWLLGYDVPMERLPPSKKLADYEFGKRTIAKQFSQYSEAEIDDFLKDFSILRHDELGSTNNSECDPLHDEERELVLAAIELGARLAKTSSSKQKNNKD